jgi:hypothetical protein
MKNWFFFILNSLYFGYVINRILYLCRSITEFIKTCWKLKKKIMLARGLHNKILFNLFWYSIHSVLNLHSFKIQNLFISTEQYLLIKHCDLYIYRTITKYIILLKTVQKYNDGYKYNFWVNTKIKIFWEYFLLFLII